MNKYRDSKGRFAKKPTPRSRRRSSRSQITVIKPTAPVSRAAFTAW